jgi:hypothetical protein
MASWHSLCGLSRRLVLGVSALAVVVALASVFAGAASASVGPKAANELDCNGWSTVYQAVKPDFGGLCTDPISVKNGKANRFIDNGWYVGHDEPSIKFISNKPGSGNQMTYYMQLPIDPTATPTPSGSVTNYGELSVAPWFGLPICDPNSYPQNPCKPDSDKNSGSISDPNAAGSAFLELQLYPPGFTPFIDSESCSETKWCSALTIDSLECTFNFATCNPACEEPVNFAFLQNDGVPAGPPSAQLTDVSTLLANQHTLEMNGGDVLEISLSDPPQGLTAVIKDLTTGQTGFIVASASNGFMNTNIADCSGTPFTFHAEYNTAKQQNQVPWAALEGGVLMEQEIGHGESCNSLTNQDAFSVSYPDGSSYSDSQVFDTCNGGLEGPGATGEGPCTSAGCQNATTQGPTGPTACSTNDPASGALCEFADGYCFPQGERQVVINTGSGPIDATESSALNFCFADRFQNGDLDFDGTGYVPFTWPDGTANHPTPASYIGPFTSGKPYPTIQFESDVGGSSNLCDTSTGAGCLVPPISAAFYPYWSLSNPGGRSWSRRTPSGTCVWNFGKSIRGLTTQDFGGDAQYGTSNVARYGGTIISEPMKNPEFNGSCSKQRY